MGSAETERLLQEIGQLLAEDDAYPLDGTLLHARIDHNWVAPSIFKNRGNHVLYRDPDLDRLGDALLDLWEEQEDDPRWAEIEYVIRDGKFEILYTYSEDVDPEEEPFDRRDRIVQRYFGDKPILYPGMSDDDDAPQYEL